MLRFVVHFVVLLTRYTLHLRSGAATVDNNTMPNDRGKQEASGSRGSTSTSNGSAMLLAAQQRQRQQQQRQKNKKKRHTKTAAAKRALFFHSVQLDFCQFVLSAKT